jgi:outer membrane receptor protein involved in Fe transport
MRALSKCLIGLCMAWGASAHAQEPEAPAPADPEGLSDEELARLAEGESIEIFDERPDKPFDRDTEVRLTGEELAARGAVDLASALELLPDVSVRDVGRGGFNVDIRGARKGSVSVLIDGVLVSDPYYGTFDVSTIPITDIVQVRMSTSPQSPIDGPGGPGGVIEVLTRDAIGTQLVIARATSDTLPSLGIAGMARVALTRKLALRFSASGTASARDFDVQSGSVDENRHTSTGAARLEYRDANRRLAIDGFLDDRHYISPPSETSSILLIDRETTARALAKGDLKRDKLQLQGQAFVQNLHRRSRNFKDADLTIEQQVEDLHALRIGGMALATRPLGKDFRWVASTSVARDSANTSVGTATTRGDLALLESAADLQYEHQTVRVDGAAGIAVPIGVSADPWPEAKLVAKWRPAYGPIELSATGARKGRVPTLRERFEPMTGNAALAPEHATHGELRAVGEIKDQFRVEVAPFYRHTTGVITNVMGQLANRGSLDFYGLDTSGRVYVSLVQLGAAYNFIDLRNCGQPDCTFERLPRHRAEGWVEVTPEERIVLSARVRYYGAFSDQGMALPAYTTVEATATATLSRKYLVVLRGDDLLNARPQTRQNYFGPGLVISVVLQGQWE